MGDEKEGGNVTQAFTEYSELEGAHQDHQVQLFSKLRVMGMEPTTLGISACESSVTLASIGTERFSKVRGPTQSWL